MTGYFVCQSFRPFMRGNTTEVWIIVIPFDIFIAVPALQKVFSSSMTDSSYNNKTPLPPERYLLPFGAVEVIRPGKFQISCHSLCNRLVK
jgi:hypothetical protein